MSDLLDVEVMALDGLGATERAAWDRFVDRDEARDDPFLHRAFAEIAGSVVPGAAVAVLHRRGEIAGFFPFQKRGTELHPLGAPLADYHAVVGDPAGLDLKALARAAGAEAIQLSGLVGSAEAAAGLIAHETTEADLSAGYEAWLTGRRAEHNKFFKDKARAARALERDHGGWEVRFPDDDPTLFDRLLDAKREQYRRTGQYDVLACGWTVELLRALMDRRCDRFGGAIASLRVGGEIAALEYSLIGGRGLHFWFPVYDPRFHRGSPGVLLTLETMRLGADMGLTRFDFGPGPELYKKYFRTASRTVREGAVIAHPVRAALARAADVLGGAPQSPLARTRLKLARRLRMISACTGGPGEAAVAAAGYAACALSARLKPAAARAATAREAA